MPSSIDVGVICAPLSDAEADDEMSHIRHEMRTDRPHTYPRKRSLKASSSSLSGTAGDGRKLADIEHQQIGALYQGYGTHYVDVWVGTPPQRQTVIVDTGSGVTAFPCSGCKDCGRSYHTDSFFVEDDSVTFRMLSCDDCFKGSCGRGITKAGSSGSERICKLSMSYSEGSKWSAYEAVDSAYAGGPHDEPLLEEDAYMTGQFPLAFGCQTLITGLFKTQLADGIMGMVNKGSSYWSQAYKGGAMAKKAFSLCFTRQPTASREGTEAGALTLGGTDERLHTSPMVYATNMKPNSGYFTVNLKNVYLREGGGDSAKFSEADGPVHAIDVDASVYRSAGSHGHIVDSGTTMTYVDKKVGAALKVKWEEIAGMKYTTDEMSLTEEQLNSLPTVLFQFEASKDGENSSFGGEVTGLAGGIDVSSPKDVIVAMPASHYMSYDSEKGVYKSGLYLDKRSGSTLGANLMMGHDVVFDVENGRIGWAESDCDYFDVMGFTPPGSDGREGPNGSMDDDEAEVTDDALRDRPTSPSGVGPSVDAADDVVCPTTGCKMGVLAVVAVVVTLFIVYRRRYGRDRPDRRGIEAVPTTDDDLELYEEESGKDGYSDDIEQAPSQVKSPNMDQENDASYEQELGEASRDDPSHNDV